MNNDFNNFNKITDSNEVFNKKTLNLSDKFVKIYNDNESINSKISEQYEINKNNLLDINNNIKVLEDYKNEINKSIITENVTTQNLHLKSSKWNITNDSLKLKIIFIWIIHFIFQKMIDI